jgi:spore coat protein CotH
MGTGTLWLGRYKVVDASLDHPPASLPDLTVAAGDFLRVAATDTAPEDGSPWVPFKLGSSDGLTLFEEEVQVDALAWSELPAGATWGRLPDGTGDAAWLLPTPGAANQAWTGVAAPGSEAEGTLFDPDRVVTVKLAFSDADWQAIIANAKAEQYYPASLEFDGVVVENVAARTKGNSSLNAVANPTDPRHRYPFKVDLNAYVAGQKLRGNNKFVLNNGMKDPTLLREHMAYGLMREFGLPAPRTGFADLWVNTEHLGVYTLVEVVDDDFLQDHFEDPEGDLYKPEMDAGDLSYKGDDAATYTMLGLETNLETSDGSDYIALCKGIAEGSLGSVLDVDNALRYLAINTLLVNLDSYLGTGHNFYLYEDSGIFSVIPWDTNEAFGNFSCGCTTDGILDFRIDEPTCGSLEKKALAKAIIADPALKASYHALLSDLVGGLFAEDAMSARIDHAADLIRPHLEQDPTKFFTMSQFEAGLDQGSTTTSPAGGAGTGTGGSKALGLKAFVAARIASVKGQLEGTLSSTANATDGSCSENMGQGAGGGKRPPPPKP